MHSQLHTSHMSDFAGIECRKWHLYVLRVDGGLLLVTRGSRLARHGRLYLLRLSLCWEGYHLSIGCKVLLGSVLSLGEWPIGLSYGCGFELGLRFDFGQPSESHLRFVGHGWDWALESQWNYERIGSQPRVRWTRFRVNKDVSLWFDRLQKVHGCTGVKVLELGWELDNR